MKSVLLVNDNQQECELICGLFSELYPDAAVRIAADGRSALDNLMGAPDSEEEPQLNPDIIIISDSVSDLTPAEICRVVSNYYRFRHIKFYLLADPAKIQPEASDRALFNGYLNRPFGNDTDTREKFAQLKADLASDHRKLALFPFLGIIKSKLVPLTGSLSGGVKAAACIACIGTAAVVVPEIRETDGEKQLTAVPAVGTLADDYFLPVEILPPVVEPVMTESEVVTEAPVKKKEVLPEVQPEPAEVVPPKDTVMHKKTFSIGVKKVDQSKP